MANQSPVTDGNPAHAYHEEEYVQDQTAKLDQTRYALKQAQADKEKLLAAFDGLSDGFLLLHHNNKVQAVNQALADLTGSDTERLTGKDWRTLAPPLYSPAVENLVQQTRSSGSSYHCREQYTSPDGQRYTFDIWARPLEHHQHQKDLVLIHIVDITERLQLEAMLLQSERLAASGKLSATVAHEVNSPLQTIQSAIYMAERASESQRSHYLAVASAQIERISTIIRRMIDLYQVGDSSFQWINMHQLLKRLLELLAPTLQEQHIHVQTDLWRHLPLIWGHTDHLTQVLLNTILNAIEAMEGGGILSVRTSPAPHMDNYDDSSERVDTWVQIEISDTGSGMMPEVRECVFDPFFTTRPGNLGIGMTVCQKIITDHGGQISLDSVAGAGTTVTFRLPTTATDPEKPAIS